MACAVLNQLSRRGEVGREAVVLPKLLIVSLKHALQLSEIVVRNALASTRRKGQLSRTKPAYLENILI